MNITDKTALQVKVANTICGALTQPLENLSKEDKMRRFVCWALTDHYIGMATNDYRSPGWIQDQSGWANVFDAVVQAKQIVQQAGCAALDFLDVENLAEQVKAECSKAGLVAKIA